MRLFGVDCGCENRREIMFSGDNAPGIAEGAILAAVALMLISAAIYSRSKAK